MQKLGTLVIKRDIEVMERAVVWIGAPYYRLLSIEDLLAGENRHS